VRNVCVYTVNRRSDLINISISSTSDKPIYEQIVDKVQESIMIGELKEGQMMPSIRKLAKDLGISVITIKRAYDDLEKEGYISTVPGRGSYVTAQNEGMVKENQVKIVEDKLFEAVIAAKSIHLSRGELIDMLLVLYEA